MRDLFGRGFPRKRINLAMPPIPMETCAACGCEFVSTGGVTCVVCEPGDWAGATKEPAEDEEVDDLVVSQRQSDDIVNAASSGEKVTADDLRDRMLKSGVPWVLKHNRTRVNQTIAARMQDTLEPDGYYTSMGTQGLQVYQRTTQALPDVPREVRMF